MGIELDALCRLSKALKDDARGAAMIDRPQIKSQGCGVVNGYCGRWCGQRSPEEGS